MNQHDSKGIHRLPDGARDRTKDENTDSYLQTGDMIDASDSGKCEKGGPADAGRRIAPHSAPAAPCVQLSRQMSGRIGEDQCRAFSLPASFPQILSHFFLSSLFLLTFHSSMMKVSLQIEAEIVFLPLMTKICALTAHDIFLRFLKRKSSSSETVL